MGSSWDQPILTGREAGPGSLAGPGSKPWKPFLQSPWAVILRTVGAAVKGWGLHPM